MMNFIKSDELTAKAISLIPSVKTFYDTYTFLQKSQWWSHNQLEEYQMVQLSKLLIHAYNNVPYYRRVFDERGLKPANIQSTADLKKLPYLTKEIIRENLPDLVARNYAKPKLEYVTTGGSTGIPLGFYYEKGFSRAREQAFMTALWNRVGYRLSDKCVLLRGYVVDSASKGTFWKYSLFGRWLILSSYHMTDKLLPSYIAKIREFRPAYIQAYPSAVTLLARFMKGNNMQPFPSIRAILCQSENMYPWQRQLLEQVFQCRVYSWYGHTEQAVLAGECEKSVHYHLNPEYGITEIVDNNVKVIAEEDKMGEIVATGLNNFLCPFIRYRTMDLAIPANAKCECGRQYSLLKKVEGRTQDLIVTKDKRLITLTALIFGLHFSAFSKVKEMQLIQEREGEIVVRIQKTYQYSDSDERELLSKMQSAIGDGLKIDFDYVDSIPRTEQGKYKFLIQKLPIAYGD
jgi:phenylacetate-CoA ligase